MGTDILFDKLLDHILDQWCQKYGLQTDAVQKQCRNGEYIFRKFYSNLTK